MSLNLFTICLDFISTNICDVESLIGLPQLIGDQLFKVCVRKNKFCNAKENFDARKALYVFFEAYGEYGALINLNVQHCHLFVNDILISCTWLLSNVVHLNLSSCKLGDDHELLPHILSLNRLKVLNLHDNCLTDLGIRKGTLRLRFLKQINSSLEHLNLSRFTVSTKISFTANSVTQACLDYLQSFKNLCLIVLSSRSLCHPLKTCKFEMKNNFKCQDACSCIIPGFTMTTTGWMKEVIENWKKEYTVATSDQPSATTPTLLSSLSTCHGVKSFYSRCRTIYDKDQGSASSIKDTCELQIILTTDMYDCPHMSSKDCSHMPSKSVHGNPVDKMNRRFNSRSDEFISELKRGKLEISDCIEREDNKDLLKSSHKKSYLLNPREEVKSNEMEGGCDQENILSLYTRGDKPARNPNDRNDRGARLKKISVWD